MNESVDLREGSEVEISRLFPKCRPRSTPTSPNNPPTTPIPSTTTTPSNNACYNIANATLHSPNVAENLSQTSNPIINSALNKSPQLNPNTITYSANSLPIHSYSNINTSNTNLYDSKVSSHSITNQSLPINGKVIHSSVISHPSHNINFVPESDDNKNYANSHPPGEEVVHMQESTSSNSSSSSTAGSGSSSRMSVDTASSNCSPAGGGGVQTTLGSALSSSVDVSVVSGYHEQDHNKSSVLDSSYEDMPLPQSRREHFRLRDSRIEAAGGRELYSQSRSRMHRHRGNSAHMNIHPNLSVHSQQASKQQQLVQLQHQNQQLTVQSQSSLNQLEHIQQNQHMENSSASSSSSRTSRESGLPSDSPLVYEARLAGSSEIVFDDIGEWSGGLTVRGVERQPRASSTSTSGPDSDSPEISPTRVTKIGNVQIDDYEGSPRRYGPRSTTTRHSPRRSHGMRPRPGFPRRISHHEEVKQSEKKDMSYNKEQIATNEKWIEKAIAGSNSCPEIESRDSPAPPIISISTLTSVYASTFEEAANSTTTTTTTTADSKNPATDPELYDYEVSETQKVLREFFQDSRVSRPPPQGFYDLEYHLKRHHGNSYVGQRLAEEYESNDPLHLMESQSCDGPITEKIESTLLNVEERKPDENLCDLKHDGEETTAQKDGDQVIKYDNTEVSRRLFSSLHQCSSYSHRQFSHHHRSFRHDKHNLLRVHTSTPERKSSSSSQFLINCSSFQAKPQCPHYFHNCVKSDGNSCIPVTPTSSLNKCNAPTNNFSFNFDSVSDLDISRTKTDSILDSNDIRDCNISNDICHNSFIHLGNSLDENLLQLCDNRENSNSDEDDASDKRSACGYDSHEEDIKPTEAVETVPKNCEDKPDSDDDDDDHGVTEDDLVDLDVDEEELRLSLNDDEEIDRDDINSCHVETVDSLLDLPVEFPILDDNCLANTLESNNQNSAKSKVFTEDSREVHTGDDALLLVSAPIADLDNSGLEIYLSEASHQVTLLVHLLPIRWCIEKPLPPAPYRSFVN